MNLNNNNFSKISPFDNMFANNYEHYFNVGSTALGIIKKHIGLKKVYNILDFGCGYGRVTRHLKSYFNLPYQKILCSDIDTRALNFCKETFCVDTYNLSDIFNSDIKFDIIWMGSVITHLDSGKTDELFNNFFNILNFDGYLIFSSHGQKVFNRINNKERLYGLTESAARNLVRNFRETGYGYSNYTNQDYGISCISNLKMQSIIAKNGLTFANFEESLWDNHHDIYCTIKK